MGHSTTPRYRLETITPYPPDQKKVKGVLEWNCKCYGKPGSKALERWIESYVDSLKTGRINEGLSKALGFMPIPSRAAIVDQMTGEEVALWVAPAFMAL